jgi:hypothetical protein
MQMFEWLHSYYWILQQNSLNPIIENYSFGPQSLQIPYLFIDSTKKRNLII